MAIKHEVSTSDGVANYFRIRSIVLFRDVPGKISGFSEQRQPTTQLQVDFEVYKSKKIRDEGGAPIRGVQSLLFDLKEHGPELLSDEFIASVYRIAATSEVFAGAEDI